MMMKTRIFVAKTIAKKSYKDAMDAMKTLKGKIKKPKGIKEKTIANFNKVKTGVKKESKRVVTFAKDYPGLSAATIGLGGAIGYGTGKAIGSKKQKKG